MLPSALPVNMPSGAIPPDLHTGEGLIGFPKISNYRNQKLRDLAKEVPHCMYCCEPNHGQVVLCHSNSQKHGKGLGIKAHDVPCYLCDRCHALADGRMGPHLDKRDRDLILYEGVYNSVLWILLEKGWLK